MSNKKKPLIIRNTTNYFNPETTRTYNSFSSPYTYQSRQQKIEAYETRLYWQYRYCEDHDGQTFFYTLTYNNRHLPSYYGQPCFDYNDLADIVFTGSFRMDLLRKYGTKMKYFVGAELGDGKGERGLLNNPHYHILFFLEPANDERYPYIKISPEHFRHLVRMAWQGFDEDIDGWHDYRKARKGIAREGEPEGIKMLTYGKVIDFRACMYCAKYVCKDAKLKRHERNLRRYLAQDLYDKYYKSTESYIAFFNDYLSQEYHNDYVQGILKQFPDILRGEPYTKERESAFHFFMARTINKVLGIAGEYSNFVRLWTKPMIMDYIKEYRNRYCNKCRISQGLGIYAIQQPGYDKFSGTIPVPDAKKGFKRRPISMFYYRKLFTRVVRDEETGSPRYILNDDGVQYKMSRLPKQLDKLAAKAESHINLILSSRSLYNKMRESDCNEKVFSPYDEFLDNWNYLLTDNNIKDIVKRYAEFKLIYENRYFAVPTGRIIPHRDFPVISPCDDYFRFISTPCFDRCPHRLRSFFEDGNKGYVSYHSHDYFLRYLGIFDVLDLCADYFFVQNDDKAQAEAEQRAATKRFHDKLKLKEFYSSFLN